MRRFALTLLASLSAAALSGCAGYGGSAFGGGNAQTYDRLVFSAPGSSVNGIFKVAPAATTPLLVSVYGSKSNYALVQTDAQATWTTSYVGPPAVYEDFAPTNQPLQRTCPALPTGVPGFATPTTALVVPKNDGSNGFGTYAGGATQTIGILPVVPQVQTAPAPTLVPPPAPYCLNVVATSLSGVVGSFIVFVGN